MLLHNVYFWLTEEITDEQEVVFREQLAELLKIDLIAHAYWGSPAPTEERPVTDHSFHTSIGLLFNSQADHDAYQTHPEHQAFVDRCEGFWAQVKVYDTLLGED